jgi:hypothetical protein
MTQQGNLEALTPVIRNIIKDEVSGSSVIQSPEGSHHVLDKYAITKSSPVTEPKSVLGGTGKAATGYVFTSQPEAFLPGFLTGTTSILPDQPNPGRPRRATATSTYVIGITGGPTEILISWACPVLDTGGRWLEYITNTPMGASYNDALTYYMLQRENLTTGETITLSIVAHAKQAVTGIREYLEAEKVAGRAGAVTNPRTHVAVIDAALYQPVLDINGDPVIVSGVALTELVLPGLHEQWYSFTDTTATLGVAYKYVVTAITLDQQEGVSVNIIPSAPIADGVSIVEAIADAQGLADQVLGMFTAAENDGLLTEIEKPQYRVQWIAVTQEYASVIAAAPAGLSTANYTAAYSGANGLLGIATDWTSVGTTDISARNPTVAARWSAYFSERTKLQVAIGDAAWNKAFLALTDASNALAAADGEIVVTWNSAAPTGANAGSIGDAWIVTPSNTIYRHDGAVWVLAPTYGVALAIIAADSAQMSANGKARIFYQSTCPTGMLSSDIGDMWVDTAGNNRMWAYSHVMLAVTAAHPYPGWVLAQDWFEANAVANQARDAIALMDKELSDISADGIISPSEKPREIARLALLVANSKIMLDQAGLLNISSTDFANASGAVVSYINGLTDWATQVEIVPNTTPKTYRYLPTAISIHPVTGYARLWHNYEVELLGLITRLASSIKFVDMISTVTRGDVTLPTPQDCLFDGSVALGAGKVVLLPNQTDITKNGIYTLTQSGVGEGAGTLVSTPSGAATYNTAAIGGSGSTSYAGWSGVSDNGNLRISLSSMVIDAANLQGIGSVDIYWSRDGGISWSNVWGATTAHFVNGAAASQTLNTVALGGVDQTKLMVRVEYYQGIGHYFTETGGDWAQDVDGNWYRTPYERTTTYVYSNASVTVADSAVNFISTGATGGWALTHLAQPLNKDSYLVGSGDTYHGKNVQVTVNVDNSMIVSAGTKSAVEPALPVNTLGPKVLQDNNGTKSWVDAGSGGGGSISGMSVVNSNGFAGSVATPTTTPAITITTTVSGLLKGNGTGVSAATAGTDYAAASHAHTYASLSSIPTSFTPSTHSHAMSDFIGIAGGGARALWTDNTGLGQNSTLPIAAGGTGATSASGALTAMGAQSALGYTPVNKAGDTMSDLLTITKASGGALLNLTSTGNSPNLQLSDGTKSLLIGIDSTDASYGTKFSSTGYKFTIGGTNYFSFNSGGISFNNSINVGMGGLYATSGTFSGSISATSATFTGLLTLQTNNWHQSSDTKKRFYFNTNAKTYFGSPDGYIFRSADDLRDVLAISDAGLATFSGPNDGTGQIRMTGTGFPTHYWEMGREASSTGDFVLTQSEAGVRSTKFRIATSNGAATFYGPINIPGSSPLNFTGGGNTTYMKENYGICLYGVSAQPVQIKSASLLVGYGDQSGGGYGSGNIYAAGSVTAISFSGSGSGLTGTASSLTAGSATNFNNGYASSSNGVLACDVLDSYNPADQLELCYYNGTGVVIGTGSGTKFLKAGSIYSAGNYTGSITQGSYGAISIGGNTAGYSGINFSDYYVTLMVNRAYQGVYRDNATWLWAFAEGVLTDGWVPGTRVTGTVPSATALAGHSAGYAYADGGTSSACSGTATYATNAGNFNNGSSYSSGGNLHCVDMYADGGWFRNSSSQIGLYNSAHATHFYADSAGYWRVCSNNGLIIGVSSVHNSSAAGYVYHDGSGFGFLNDQGGWSVRCYQGTGYGGQLHGSWSTTGTITGSNLSGTNTGDQTSVATSYSSTTAQCLYSASYGGFYYAYTSATANSIAQRDSFGQLTAVDFYATSDQRYKKDIKPIENALIKISRLNGVSYTWNELAPSIDKDTLQLGVIAQEVLAVCPEAVSQDDNGFYSVSYDKLVPLLIEGMKMQQKQIDELREGARR